MSKRTISDVVDADTSSPSSSQPPSKRRRASPPPHERVLPYLTPDSSIPTKPTTFQRPLPLLTFSYTPERVLEFTDSALRYFVEPPPNADLNYGYDRWIQRPEERGRLDGLLKGWLKASEGKGRVEGVGAVLWRGVMTKYVFVFVHTVRRPDPLGERILTSVYEETDSLELNVMKVKGIMYLEEHLSDAALRDKCVYSRRKRCALN
jgi:RAT1-interacting protein